ncbi:protease modulator HflC [Methylovirgula ligni]|uniref:Protein HflC n=1 Tax=Methylovirgula ligni TaxID=569860 RepID=A0A3D9ZCL1_9HYPH|nr:protease modulator HflC [Methylovirgula ligni]QAY95465.1 protease modulator HflC [Methylovirgula ligni]REF89206.1 membrane protease subunit HflC [Methylovirgula ligni]
MKSATGFFIVLVAVVAVVVAVASIFTVGQTEQALVLRFGDPVAGRGLVTEPGLHFKIPFIENVVLLDKRILDVETPTQEVLAADNTRVEVDSFLRYRIADPLKFYQTVGDTDRADVQLGYILNSAVRRVLGDASLSQIVSGQREALMGAIREQVNQQTSKLGVAAVDVRIRRTDLPQQISEKVFSRMQSEWARQAALFRAQGTEQAQEITAKADRDAVVLKADAQRDADQVRGAGDAERARVFAAAFGKDPEFFAFYRSMQAYVAGLKPSNTRYVLSPKSAFFRYFTLSGETSTPPSSAAH